MSDPSSNYRRLALFAVVALAACKKAEQQAPVPTPAPPVIAPVAPDAAPVAIDAGAQADVELLHAIPTRIRVSSTVANPKILPAHIADGDLTTAWNSKTGELVGAWIEITLGEGAEAHELRMTAGFTAKGPKNEDWFTMNPRIKKVTVEADGKAAGTFTLDVANRGLQVFAVTATQTVRLTIAEIAAGSKKTWREASISEIELWGRPPAGWSAPKVPLDPFVGVGEESLPSAPDDPCAEIDARREAFIAEHANDHHEGPGGEDHNYPPRCDLFEVSAPDDLPEPWRGAQSYCEVNDEIYGPKRCTILISRGTESAWVEIEHEAQSAVMKGQLEAKDVVPSSPGPELVVHIDHPNGASVAVCRSAPKLGCSAPILVRDENAGWTTRERFDKTGALVLDKLTGDPPAGALGVHPLVWPN